MSNSQNAPKKNKKKQLTTDQYTRLRKYVNQYHHFTFSIPKKGKDYKTSQKSAITRQFNKLKDLIQNTRLEKMSFINTTRLRKKQIPKNDGVKTNKGFFFKFPFSSIKDVSLKRGEPKTKLIVTDFRKISQSKLRQGTTSSDTVQIYIAIPEYVKQSLESITNFIDALKKQYKPDYIMLNAEGRLYSTQFNIKEFFSGSGKNVTLKPDDSDEEEEIVEDNTGEQISVSEQDYAEYMETHFFYAVLLGFFKRTK